MNTFWIEVLPNGKVVSSSALPEGVTPNPLNGGKMVVVSRLCVPNEAAYFNGQIVDIGKPMTTYHEYDFKLRQWIDLRDLGFYKTEQWSQIKKHRDAIEFGPFMYNGMEFDGDVDAQRRLNSYISLGKSAIAAGLPFNVPFTLRDNTEVTLSAEDFIGIEQNKVQVVAAAFAKASTLRSLIDAATNKEDVLVITWESL